MKLHRSSSSSSSRSKNGCVNKAKSFATLQKLTKQIKFIFCKKKCDLIDNECQQRQEAINNTDGSKNNKHDATGNNSNNHQYFTKRGARYLLRRGMRKDFLHNGSFHEAIGPVLVIAQFFCLMPVRGILSRTTKDLSFRWCSFRTFYCVFYMLATLVSTGFMINMVANDKPDVRDIEPVIFHLSTLTASIGFLRLAAKWPKLMRNWAKVEQQLPAHSHWYEREELARKIKKVTFVLIMLSMMEHLLSIISGIHFANYCPSRTDPIESFFASSVSQFFYVFQYSTWLGLLGKMHNILMTFGWTYMDVFVMIMGIGLTSLFQQVQRSIVNVQNKSMPESFWTTTRLQYRAICDLIEEVDDAISGITMISFANNLYYVCIQLLKSINKMPSFAHVIYFYFSLIFLLVRTLAVSLYLSQVNDCASDPLPLLKQVSKNDYCAEIERFANEIATDVVALTGLKFFSVTRKLVMKVAGTIVTYELVLIQFHEDQNLWHCGED